MPERVQIMLALGELRDPRAVPLLAAFLTDTTEVRPRGLRTIREVAINALGALGSSDALDSVLPLLATDDEGWQERVATAVIRMGPSAFEALLHRLTHDDARMRMGAVRALGLLGDARSIGPLLMLSQSDPSDAVRRRAMQAVLRIREET